jgi:phosphate transport system protein
MTRVLRQAVEQKQQRLRDEVLVLGSRVIEALHASIETLAQQDFRRAMVLIGDGRIIVRRCEWIEADALVLLTTQQPMAGDLRILTAILQISQELMQIGDHVSEISTINLKLKEQIPLNPLLCDLGRMAKIAGAMLQQALEAFVKQDVMLAQAVPSHDDQVDELYTHI